MRACVLLPESWSAGKKKVFHRVCQFYGQMVVDNRFGIDAKRVVNRRQQLSRVNGIFQRRRGRLLQRRQVGLHTPPPLRTRTARLRRPREEGNRKHQAPGS